MKTIQVQKAMCPAQLHKELIDSGVGADILTVRGFKVDRSTGIAASGEVACKSDNPDQKVSLTISAHIPIAIAKS